MTPEIDGTINIEIRSDELRRDTFRSGGPGGQHQNKTESGVRYTHLPTGIAAESRSQRSQHKNDDMAMKMLKAGLYQVEEQKQKAEVEKLYDEKGEVAWGYQIRNYVLQPYTLAKDVRTEVQTAQVQNVLDGDIDEFIQAYLRLKAKKKTSRRLQVYVSRRHWNAAKRKPCSLRGDRLGPPRAEDMNLLEDDVLLPAVLGGGQLGLELGHLFLAVITAFQFATAFDHVGCPALRVGVRLQRFDRGNAYVIRLRRQCKSRRAFPPRRQVCVIYLVEKPSSFSRSLSSSGVPCFRGLVSEHYPVRTPRKHEASRGPHAFAAA